MSTNVWAAGSAVQKIVRATDAQNFTFNSEDGPSFILPTVAFPTVAELTVDVDGLIQTSPDNFGYVVAERRLTFAADLPPGLKVHVAARGKSEIEVPQSTLGASPLGQALISSSDTGGMHSILGLGTIVSANAEDVQAALRFQDDGSPVAGTDTINFVGTGVSVANVAGAVVVTIPGALAAPVQSVVGQVGAVSAEQIRAALPAAVAGGNAGLLTGADKTKLDGAAQQTALDAKAPLASPTFTGTVSVPNINGAALGPKNKLFNGCMRIPSPNGASGSAVLGVNIIGAAELITVVYGFATFSGAIYQATGVQDARTSTGAMHYLAFAATTGGSGNVLYLKRVSAEDALTMANKQITVSCRAMAAGTTPSRMWLRYFKADAYNNFATATWIADGPKLNTSSMSTPVELEFTFTPTYADCANGLSFEMFAEYTGANGSPQNPSYLSIADFQVIEGSKRLPFETRPLELEKALVNRFKPTAPINLTANTTLASNAKYSYSAGALTLTLPAAPVNGDEVVIYNTGSLLTTVVGRNGKTIMGLAQNMTLDIANKKYVFEYLSASGDWRLS